VTRRRSADDAKAEIREAALDLFLQQGYDAASLEEVAERVGVTRPAVLYHFGSKEALLLSVVEPGFDAMDALVSGFEAADPGLVDRETVLRGLVAVLLEHRRPIALISRFANDYSVGGIGERAQRMNLRSAILLGGPATATDSATQIRVIATLAALGGIIDARVALPLATMEDQEVLVRGLLALLKS
jgi:AcrR family transcriptional regulator